MSATSGRYADVCALLRVPVPAWLTTATTGPAHRILSCASRWSSLPYFTSVPSTTAVRHTRACRCTLAPQPCRFSVVTEFSLREGVVHTTVMQNVKQVISQKDVVQDAYHNFMPSYQVGAPCCGEHVADVPAVCSPPPPPWPCVLRTTCCIDRMKTHPQRRYTPEHHKRLA